MAVDDAEAPPSVVELLVVSDKSRYLKSSPAGSSEGLEEEVEEEEAHASRMIEPLVSTPKRTGLAYFMEARGRHSTRGASVVAAGASPFSAPYTSVEPNLDREFTHSCTWGEADGGYGNTRQKHFRLMKTEAHNMSMTGKSISKAQLKNE